MTMTEGQFFNNMLVEESPLKRALFYEYSVVSGNISEN